MSEQTVINALLALSGHLQRAGDKSKNALRQLADLDQEDPGEWNALMEMAK